MSASLAPECNDVKEKYDSCFLKWYSEKFLKGDTSGDDCQKAFEQYKKCLSKALSERGIDKMVDEARTGSKEHDTEHLKTRPCMLHLDLANEVGLLSVDVISLSGPSPLP